MSETSQLMTGVLRREAAHAAVTFRRQYPVSVEELWEALTSPERLRRWLGKVTGDLRAGGCYRIDFAADGGDDDPSDRTTGTIRSCEPPRLLLLSWDFDGEPTSLVRVAVSATEDGATLELEHSRLPHGQAGGYGAGWHAHLAELGRLVRGEPRGSWDDDFTGVLHDYLTAWAATGTP
jgi:uncharacterized protein YndB with AHSA1/START domain